ncbi:uncharacterized protein LOC143230582 isoform X2 [Tachypleus tridentatus]|uniref:uncharacterized protein LOC143230582 isoform X2 n=1 Tax=Tachypleus tridentatus TaxID=6853 RepID=UPI003FD004EB
MLGMMEQMKSKSFVALLSCIIITSIVVCLFEDSKPLIHDFLSSSERQITHQLKDIKTPDVESNQEYLKILGFTDTPWLYFSNNSNMTLPVIVTAVLPGESEVALVFIKSSEKFMPEHSLILYGLDLSVREATALQEACNLTKCTVRMFEFDYLPSHLHNLKLSAYRPVIIQEVLNKVGAVLWLDVQYTFKKKIPCHLLKRAEKNGLVMWKVDHPTSSLTHQKMFDYFQVSQVYYYFHHMVESSHLILYNTETIHYRLMLPWVRCALTLDCIAPIGSQRFGCRFNKKPLYRYSGCHRYDMSALNVVLGLMYNFDSHSYAASDKDKFFGLVKQEFVSKTLKHSSSENNTAHRQQNS